MEVKPVFVEDVFSEDVFSVIADHLKAIDYYPVDLGNATMFAQELQPTICEMIEGAISKHWGKELVPIKTFARYNDEWLDTSFRVHSDGEIEGQQPTVAAVYYIDCGGSGTALMSHSTYGSRGKGIFIEDDGLWQVDQFVEGKPNSMVVYEADAFHTRYPHQAKDTRLVIVSFMREANDE